MHEAHEGFDGFFASEGDPSETFEFVEEALDLMTFLVEPPVDKWGNGAARVGLDMGGCAEIIGNEGAQRVCVVSGIGDDMTNALQAVQEGFRLRAIAVMPRCWVDAQRQAQRIDGRVQLGR